MGKLSREEGVDALYVTAIVMALAALAMGWSAVGVHSAAQLANRILAAIGFMGVSAFALWVGMALRGTRDRFRSAIPIPVYARVKDRVRGRR